MGLLCFMAAFSVSSSFLRYFGNLLGIENGAFTGKKWLGMQPAAVDVGYGVAWVSYRQHKLPHYLMKQCPGVSHSHSSYSYYFCLGFQLSGIQICTLIGQNYQSLDLRIRVFGACEGAGTVAYIMFLGH